MPEEIEVPTEHLHEAMHHAAHGHGGGDDDAPTSWFGQVALSSAVIAVAAAITALLAGHHANEAMIEQMLSTDQWALYQAKGIKASLLDNKIDILVSLGKDARDEDKKTILRYRDEQKEIEAKAHELEKSSEEHMKHHVVFARSVTAFQVAIALSAISVLSKRKALWFLSLVLGAIGTAVGIQALLP